MPVITSPRWMPPFEAGPPSVTRYTRGRLPNTQTATESLASRFAEQASHWMPKPNQPRGSTRFGAISSGGCGATGATGGVGVENGIE